MVSTVADTCQGVNHLRTTSTAGHAGFLETASQFLARQIWVPLENNSHYVTSIGLARLRQTIQQQSMDISSREACLDQL
jgi:hypothetical protein